ncbi:MAG: hypothetical protein GY875_10295 [Gammaproteobacteria bacterium]|nr:hypothetical protein [Gammaproteobacteria bacterium]
MKTKRYPPTRNRRDIGQVISPIEKMMAAREASSCCVGVEALLEIDSKQIRTVKDKARK